jgi:hypothetical protein
MCLFGYFSLQANSPLIDVMQLPKIRQGKVLLLA